MEDQTPDAVRGRQGTPSRGSGSYYPRGLVTEKCRFPFVLKKENLYSFTGVNIFPSEKSN